MKRTLRSAVALVTATLFFLFPLLSTSAQPLQQDQTFLSALTGEEIDLGMGGDVVFIPEQYNTSASGDYSEEFVWYTAGMSNFELMFVQGPTTAVEYMDVTLSNMIEYYDTFAVVDSVNGENAAWFLGEAELQGDPLLVYFEYEVDVFGDIDFGVMQFSYKDSLIDDMELSQTNVTVGGRETPMNPDLDALNAAVGVDTTETPVATADGSGVSGVGNRGTRVTRQSTSNDDDATPAVDDGTDWEAMGLVSGSEWVSPTHDSRLTWDEELWEFPSDYDQAIMVSDSGYDVLTLQSTDGMGYVFITVDSANGYDPASMVEYWVSDEYLSTFEKEIVILDSSTTRDSASIVYSTVNSKNEPLITIMDVTFEADGTAVYSQLSAAPSTIADVYGQYVDGVQLNGAPVNLTWTLEEIAALAE